VNSTGQLLVSYEIFGKVFVKLRNGSPWQDLGSVLEVSGYSSYSDTPSYAMYRALSVTEFESTIRVLTRQHVYFRPRHSLQPQYFQQTAATPYPHQTHTSTYGAVFENQNCPSNNVYPTF
jgi:hypothetical protein